MAAIKLSLHVNSEINKSSVFMIAIQRSERKWHLMSNLSKKSEQGTLELASCFLLCGACPRRRSNEASLSRYHCRQIQEMIQFYFCFLRYWSMCFSWSLQPVALCTLHTACGSLPQVSWWCFIYSQIFFLVNYTTVTSFNSFAHILSGYLLTINQKALAWQVLENNTRETAYTAALT